MTTLQITFVSESAGYNNSFGWYNSRTGEAGIIFINTNDDGPKAGISAGTTATIEAEQSDIDAGYIGFFLIPNGASRYGTGENSALSGPLSFEKKPNGDGQILDADGHKLRGEQSEIIFTDPKLNKHNTDYASAHPGRGQSRHELTSDTADGITGRIAFEDQVRHGDRDYNDLVVDVQIVQSNRPPVVDDQSFAIAENSAADTLVGQVFASDPDAGQTLSYAIVDGNDNGAFAINAATGEITVADASKLDVENPDLDSYDLTVQVTDSGALVDAAMVSIAVTNVVETLQGQALDGYIAGATVFADLDEDGVLDAGEASATTDASGNFALVEANGPLVMLGGVDISTGLAFAGVLRAPEGSTVVTPLTTLVAALVDQGQSIAQASANVTSAFGLDGLLIDGQPVDLLNFDPIPDAAAGDADGNAAAQVLAAGIQVRNTIVQVGALLAGAGATDAQAAATAALAALASSGAEANLDDPATAQALISSAADIATGVSPADIAAVAADAAQVLAASNDAVNDALAGGSGVGVLEALAKVATVAQGATLTEDLAQAGAANDPGTLTDDYTGEDLEAKINNAPVGDVDGGTTGTPGDDILTGGPGNDVMDGLGGNDQLFGLHGNDQLVGGDGNDQLVGDIGNDTLRGGAGDDVLDGGVLADFQSDVGFRDTDRADYSTAASGVNVNLASGIAQDGDGGTDTLIGVEGVIGSAHDDVLTGGSGAFVEFFRGGAGNDTIDGGSWNDRAEYMDATAGISVTPVAMSPNTRTVTGDASVGTDTLSNIEVVYGSDYADTYVATGFLSASTPGGLLSNFNSFEGRGGNDTITGNGGTRIEFTGATAGITANLVTGIATGDASVGTDTFTGVNSVRASQYADTLLGGNPFLNGFESFEGRAGNDYIEGGQGFDLAVYAFDGAITTGIEIDLAAGTVAGDPLLTGTDTLRGVEGVRGSHMSDLYNATGFSASSVNSGSLGPSGTYNEFEGMAGNDTITGNGNTRIIYTQAREGVSVDLASGTVIGGASVGTDTILGGVWAARGTNFNDVLAGSAAGEYFEGRAGDDAIDGGGGFDAAAYDVGASGGGTFVANPLGAFTATAPGLGTDTLANIVQITGTNFGDLFDGSASSLGHTFLALGGNDTLIGSQGNDSLQGGFGDDSLDGGLGDDFLSGNDGDDVLAGGAGNDSLDGWNGNDRADYSGSTGAANVDLYLGTASDGLGGTDTLVGIEMVTGTGLDDTLIGNWFANTLEGGLGNDLLRGGAGDDVLDGGVVADFQSDVGFRDTDRADYSTALYGVNVDLATGVAYDGEFGNDTLVGIEAVTGSYHDDILTGGSAAFVEYFRGGPGNDTIDGASWNDRAEYMDATAGISVNPVALAPNTRTVTGDASVGTDTLINVEIVYGSDFADSYVATGFLSASQPGGLLSNFNSFEGRGGNDTITGNGGTRIEFTGATGSIVANLATGIAAGDASVGTDIFTGVNSIRATQFADTLLGGNPLLNGFEGFDGRAGDDYIDGGQGFDQAAYAFDGPIATGITVNLAAGTVAGDPLLTGTDTLRGIEGIRGSHEADWYDATGFSASSVNSGSLGPSGTYNEFEGMAGDDSITGNGNTRIIYTAAREGVSVDLAAGTAVGDASVGTDTLHGGIFAVRGSNFDDVLFGSSAASEYFEGRAGNDAIDGGGGFDTAAYDVGASNGGIFLADVAGDLSASAPGLGVDALSGIESVIGTNFGDLFDGAAASIGYSVDGRSGNDTLIGSQGGDFLNGGSGDDTLSGGAGDDFVDGGAGNDVVDGGDGFDQTHYEFGATSSGSFVANSLGVFTASAGGTGTDTLTSIEWITGTSFGDFFDASAATGGYSFDGYIGDDTLIGSHGDDQLRGSDGNDLLVGRAGSDYLDGGFGSNDRADYSGAFGSVNVDLSFGTASDGMGGFDTLFGIEEVTGSEFDDTLLGDFANNVLLGSMGNDLLRGREGADYIVGGPGSDRIDYDSPWEGMDTVADFSAFPGGDVIDIAALLQNWTGYAGGAGGPLANFVRLETFGFDAQLEINVGPGFWQPLAYLPGNGGLSLNTLVANGNLFTGAMSGITLIGTPGNDSLIGTPGNDTILADLGNDFLRGGAGSDLLNGGFIADLQSDLGWRDSDRADYSSAFMGVDVNLATGSAQDGEGGTDTLIGIESVGGSFYNDLLTGSGAFFESFLGNAGDDTINGAGGLDSADYSNASSGVAISLGGFGGFSSSAGTVSGDASVGFDTLLDVEQFIGSNSADTLNVGSFLSASSPGGYLSSFIAIQGRGGNDTITGNGNTRIEYSGAASAVNVNLITGIATAIAPGDTSVGTDTFTGVNQVRGSSLNDILTGGNALYNSFESFDGRGGNDEIDGSTGWDRADYAFNGPVTTGITVNLAAGTVTGDPALTGSDTLLGIEAIRGSHLADSYNADGFSEFSINAGSSGTLNEFEGHAGNDTIIGNGNTRVSYSFARESVSVDLAAGTAVGGTSVGTDTFSWVNAVRGSNFDDLLTGSASNDTLEGLNGNDLLRGGAGDDVLNGGVVADAQSDVGFRDLDRADYSTASGGVEVNLATGVALDGEGGIDTLIGIEQVNGSIFGDMLIGSSTFNENFLGGASNDTIQGAGGFDRAEYNNATAGVVINLGAFGGPSNSTATVSGDASVGFDSLLDVELFTGSDFADTLNVGSFLSGSSPGGFFGNFNSFEGRGGDDVISGNGATRVEYTSATGAVTVDLAAGTGKAIDMGDTSVGTDTFTGVAQVRGSSFADTLTGGNPLYNGFEGFDGRGGNDHIDGGQGWDRAEYSFNGAVTTGITVSLAAGTVTGDPVLTGTDTLRGIEAIRGSHQADLYDATGFSGSSTNAGWNGTLNEFEGLAGNDTIIGNGNTRIAYGLAREGVSVDLGTGTVTGGASVGTDTILGGVNAASGSNFDDVLIGSASGNSLNGLSGNDLLRGGLGADFLNGGAGSDTYDFDRLEEAGDTVSGFAAGTDGDVLDIADLLAFSTSYAGGTGGLLADFVRVEASGSNGLLQIDADGFAGFQSWQTLATLLGGSGLNLDTLVNGGNLDVEAESGGITLIGTPGNDSLIGSPGNDTIIADLGNDFLRGGGGNDLLDGGVVADLQSDIGFRDSDRVDYSTAFTGVDVNLATGVALDGEGGTDTLIGIEQVNGSAFNDVLTGSSAFVEFYHGGAGNDTIDGAGGNDRAEYQDAATGVTINAAGFGSSTFAVAGDASVGMDTLSNVELFTGSNFTDTFNATGFLSASAPGGFLGNFNAIEGRGGNDVITGNGGTRIEFSSATGAVTVDLVTGTATGDASVGTDSFTGVNSVRGSVFADTLLGGNPATNGFESFEGRSGDDFIDGKSGFDRADYGVVGPIVTGINANLAAGTVTGDPALAGTDTLRSIEAIRGSYLDDVYDATGFSGSSINAGSSGTLNEFEGMAGNDNVIGNGNTRVSYVSAREAVSVDLAAGSATGGASVGTDTFSGVNAVRGSNFDDTLTGSASNDTLEGLSGNDVLKGGAGNDILDGSFGSDRADYSGSFASVNVDLLAGTAGDGMGGFDTLSNIEAVTGTGFNDSLIGNGLNNTLEGGVGNDFLRGGGGNDVLNGGVVGDLQSDVGWRDSDRVDYSSAFTGVNVNLGTGIAQDGEGGADTLIGIESVTGSFYNDLLTGTGAFFESFQANAGDDTINGAGGFDRADYVNASSGVEINLGGFGGFSNSAGTASGDASVGFDTLLDVEQFIGSNSADIFKVGLFSSGSLPGGFFSSFNVLEGRGGNDEIFGNGNTRIEYAGAVNGGVIVDLGAGTAKSVLIGGDPSVGEDIFTGVNQVRGSAFADKLTGGNTLYNSFESLDGRGGNDEIDGGDGWDRAEYAFNGAVTMGITVNLADGTVTGDPTFTGSDTLRGIESIRGSHQNDWYNATDFSGSSTNAGWNGTLNEFEGMAGNDTIIGNGSTRISYTLAREGVSVDLAAGTAVGGASVGSDTFSGVNAMRGSNFDDVLTGSASNDILEGLYGNDLLRGGAGSDVLNGGVVADFQSDVGFKDTDRADYSTASGSVNVNLASGLAQDGEGSTDTLIGIEGVIGSAYDDILTGGSNAFVEYFRGGAGNDTIDGMSNPDRAEYMNATSGIVVNLAALAPNTGTVSGDASVGTDTLINIEIVYGSDHVDSYVATGFMSASQVGGFLSNFNAFEGRGGNDSITGNGGTRIEYTGATGGIVVNLATGIATGDASVGTDTFSGVNSVRGSSFDDTLTGGNSLYNGFEAFDGRGGNDTIDGGQGWDRVDYAFSAPVTAGISVNLAAGTVTGDALFIGSDTLSGIESIRGTHLADVYDATGFSGSSTNAGWSGTLNEFEGAAGNDTVIGNGNTRASYAGARESVSVDLAAGTAVGGASVGSDSFSGVNAAVGSNFDDVLTGSASNDSLVGLSGNDLLRGGLGTDFLNGGAGSDTYDFNMLEEAADTVFGFTAGTGGDVLDIAHLLAFSTNYAGGPVADYVRVEASGPDGQLQIDTDGSTGGGNWQTLATLLGGSGLTLDTLVNGGNLDILI